MKPADKIPAPPKPGMPCPNCGRTLSDGGVIGGARCGGCASVFGTNRPTINLRRINGADFLRNIESWLEKPRTDAEIERLLAPYNLSDLYHTFGYGVFAFHKGTAILLAELNRRQMERDEKRPVQRIGDEVIFALENAETKPSPGGQSCMGENINQQTIIINGRQTKILKTRTEHHFMFELGNDWQVAKPGGNKGVIGLHRINFKLTTADAMLSFVIAYPHPGDEKLSAEQITELWNNGKRLGVVFETGAEYEVPIIFDPLPAADRTANYTAEVNKKLSAIEKSVRAVGQREAEQRKDMMAVAEKATKQVGAAMRRDNLVFSPGAMPEGSIGDALRALEPDARQIINLRLQTDKKGRRLSWPRIAELFRRSGKEDKKYSDERCRQIYAKAVKQHPDIERYVLGLSNRQKVSLADRQNTDADEIGDMTSDTRFDMHSLSDDDGHNNPGYRVTKNPRKPL
ncbi:MAG: hypothetical protein KJ964_12280 [Verrucomicrobia bacterium]|nr:hypothetical protein [Verrucomicrobiota bacterium]MBU1733999.1 hypothetical protein [Verrucomicrobiota bacterium]MBU1856653.1 hypothetical protein [Verrucomicrobiota bacterium]